MKPTSIFLQPETKTKFPLLDNNPRQFHNRPHHYPKITIWCAISKFGFIDPFLFEEDGRIMTVNSPRYVSMMEICFQSELEQLADEQYLGGI